jgi:hypothetical protein
MSDNSQTRLIPITKWNDYHSWPPAGGMRHLRFHCKTNGFASAFRKVGARVLVDEGEFFRCVERTNGHAAA